MRNVLIFLGIFLLALTLLFNFIHVAEAYLLAMTVIGSLLIGLGVVSWRVP